MQDIVNVRNVRNGPRTGKLSIWKHFERDNRLSADNVQSPTIADGGEELRTEVRPKLLESTHKTNGKMRICE